MSNIIKNKLAFITAIIGLSGGLIWAIHSNFQIEPVILAIVSAVEIIGYFLISNSDHNNSTVSKTKNEQNVNINFNVGKDESKKVKTSNGENKKLNREAILDIMISKTSILFIDDDKNFKVVKILKESGWKKTKSVTDIKTLEIPLVREADIVFVDINGVGKMLNLEFEGLDLALMLKQKYPSKKVVIYSANRNSNSFHQAWDFCDFKLEKNALPYQFQNLVEEYSIEIFNPGR